MAAGGWTAPTFSFPPRRRLSPAVGRSQPPRPKRNTDRTETPDFHIKRKSQDGIARQPAHPPKLQA